jgi:Peptidase family S51
VVIANAMDDAPPDVRRARVELELAALADLGFDAVELDLRDYFAQQQRLRRELAGVSMAWLRGGNVFTLLNALYRSGGDVVLDELLAADALVYAGYSAGPCVLSPGLRGLELVDDADASRGPTAPGRCGMAWPSSLRRSSRITGHLGIPRRLRSSWPWPGTAPKESHTALFTTGGPCSSTARKRGS